jgi:16S rRNA (cytosine967-C5)-methyltransferase
LKKNGLEKSGNLFPIGWDKVGENAYGKEWNQIIHALNEPAKVVLRTNTLLTNRDTLKKALQEEGIETKKVGEEGLVLIERKNVFQTGTFKKGWFEVQDASSKKWPIT